jgi:hypothetical protein
MTKHKDWTEDAADVEAAALLPPARQPNLPKRGRAKQKDNNQIIQKRVQKFLRAQDPKSKDPCPRLQSALESLFRMGTDPRSGQAKASIELLFAYGFDKPKPAPDELEAMKGGFQVVFVERGGLEGVPKRELPAAEGRPEFIDAEILEDDK